MAQDSFRRSKITLVAFGPLAVAAAVATLVAERSMTVSTVQLSLPDTGAGAGNTSIVLKVNGVAVTPTISLPGASAAKAATAFASKAGVQPFPAGVLVQRGDILTVDVTAVPAGSAPAGASIFLDVVQLDVA